MNVKYLITTTCITTTLVFGCISAFGAQSTQKTQTEDFRTLFEKQVVGDFIAQIEPLIEVEKQYLSQLDELHSKMIGCGEHQGHEALQRARYSKCMTDVATQARSYYKRSQLNYEKIKKQMLQHVQSLHAQTAQTRIKVKEEDEQVKSYQTGLASIIDEMRQFEQSLNETYEAMDEVQHYKMQSEAMKLANLHRHTKNMINSHNNSKRRYQDRIALLEAPVTGLSKTALQIEVETHRLGLDVLEVNRYIELAQQGGLNSASEIRLGRINAISKDLENALNDAREKARELAFSTDDDTEPSTPIQQQAQTVAGSKEDIMKILRPYLDAEEDASL